MLNLEIMSVSIFYKIKQLFYTPNCKRNSTRFCDRLAVRKNDAGERCAIKRIGDIANFRNTLNLVIERVIAAKHTKNVDFLKHSPVTFVHELTARIHKDKSMCTTSITIRMFSTKQK